MTAEERLPRHVRVTFPGRKPAGEYVIELPAVAASCGCVVTSVIQASRAEPTQEHYRRAQLAAELHDAVGCDWTGPAPSALVRPMLMSARHAGRDGAESAALVAQSEAQIREFLASSGLGERLRSRGRGLPSVSWTEEA